ncbi:antibiotic biosynthesis monooxygenase [Lentzea sp. BCCO 10_0061]|uniref:Antibiotic biosynthesis monooxygenase n=1 Tax=Lentzea sokolovensis TaxID=3095429 RepID=A0ABU4V065_9PSEU|nr:antibiotic biosynthesis monooxygenase [Lentzea sp. BCCO 10_0061]MDX8145146.1 antibiotic biosynthesis monooxygenase [Lentzea sp. BCCO 10_0061]
MTLPELPSFIHDRKNLDGFTLYRSGDPRDRREPGCVVLVTVDTDSEATARAWVDSVFVALASEPNPHPGGISAAFHIRDDGRRVINYAEWVSAEDHVDAVSSGGGVGSATADWRRVQNFPGVQHVSVERYRPLAKVQAEVE